MGGGGSGPSVGKVSVVGEEDGEAAAASAAARESRKTIINAGARKKTTVGIMVRMEEDDKTR